MSLNTCIFSGHLTRDVELKFTQKGTAVGNVGLAVNRVYTTGDGEKREEVAFLDLTLWGRTAEIAGEYLKKGSYAAFTCYASQETWEDKQTGSKRSKIVFVVDKLELVPGRRDSDPNKAPGAADHDKGGYTAQAKAAAQPPIQPKAIAPPIKTDPDLDIFGDDIPF